MGLAVLVMLWGLGYKLSLYRHHANATPRTPVAKLWAGPRSKDLARIAIARRASPSGPEFHIFTAVSAQLIREDCFRALSHESGACRCDTVCAVSPSRAPPSQTLSLM
jgi:hypothetical protein